MHLVHYVLATPTSLSLSYRKCCIKPFKEKALEHVHGYIYYYSMIYILPCTHFEFSRLPSNEAANCDFTCSLHMQIFLCSWNCTEEVHLL